MKIKKILAMLLASAVITTSFTGCGINKNSVGAELNGEDITLGLINFACRYNQAGSDDFIKQLGGWDSDLMGNGQTMQESTKESVLNGIHELYTMKAHMSDYKVELTEEEKKKISEVAKTFMEANEKDALEEIGATQEIVEEYLSLYTIRSKMYAAIVADVDTNVSDEEGNLSSYSYVKYSLEGTTNQETGETTELTEDEKKKIKEDAKALSDKIASGTKLEDAVKDNKDLSVQSGTYSAKDENIDAKVEAALDGLKEGATSTVVEAEDGLYIVRLDKKLDKEATEKNKEEIIKNRKQEKYEEVLKKLQEDDKWTIKTKKIEQIKFDDYFTRNASTEATTEDGHDHSTEEASESVQTTEQ